MRYQTPCVENAEFLLCPQCTAGRCVVIEFHDDGVPMVEHISTDDLIMDPESEGFGVGAKVIRP
jgi:hypothetical protein